MRRDDDTQRLHVNPTNGGRFVLDCHWGAHRAQTRQTHPRDLSLKSEIQETEWEIKKENNYNIRYKYCMKKLTDLKFRSAIWEKMREQYDSKDEEMGQDEENSKGE